MLGMKLNSDALSRKLRNYVKNKMRLNYLVWALRVEKPPTIIKRWPQSHSNALMPPNEVHCTCEASWKPEGELCCSKVHRLFIRYSVYAFLFSPKTVQDLKNQSVSIESIWIQYQTMYINNNNNNNVKMVKITITNAYFTITF